MSLLAVQGGATGTGTVTLLAPVTNTNRTLTLPDATGTVLDSTGGTTQTALTVTNGASIQGLTVGRGAGAVATNTAVGFTALAANTSGSNNVAVGYRALSSMTTGNTCVAIGQDALKVSVAGTENTAVGFQSMAATLTASRNSALGLNSLAANTTGTRNTGVGAYSLHVATTGNFNTAVGDVALEGLTTGSSNTAIGIGSGGAITTGSKNTIIGGYTGNQGGLDIRTGSNRTVLSDGDGNVRYYHDGSATGLLFPNIIGSPTISYNWDTARLYPSLDASLNLGLAGNRWNTLFASNGTINTSDRNEKQDIQNLSVAELAVAQEIKGLFKSFRWKSAVAAKGDGARIHVGVIAQDVQEAFAKHGLDAARYAMWCSDTWYEVDGKPSPTAAEPFTADTPNAVQKTLLGIRYEELLAFVIAAL